MYSQLTHLELFYKRYVSPTYVLPGYALKRSGEILLSLTCVTICAVTVAETKEPIHPQPPPSPPPAPNDKKRRESPTQGEAYKRHTRGIRKWILLLLGWCNQDNIQNTAYFNQDNIYCNQDNMPHALIKITYRIL